jgi:hypothetical protein
VLHIFLIYIGEMNAEEVIVRARALGGALEPFVGQVYFSPECHSRYEALGFKPSPGEMNGVASPEGISYFTSRGSLMGQVPGELVAAAFAVFNPAIVVPAVTAGWKITDAVTICAERCAGAVAQLQRILGPQPDGIEEVRDILQRSAEKLRPEGRPLFAGTLSQSMPEDPLAAAWHLGDMLREFRGDAHTAAWTSAGLDATEIGLLTELYWGLPLKSYSRTRGWSESDYADAIERLESRGLIANNAFTESGRSVREEVERNTDRQMIDAINAIESDFDAAITLLRSWSKSVRQHNGYPQAGPQDLAKAANK